MRQKLLRTLFPFLLCALLAGCVTAIDPHLPYPQLPEITLSKEVKLWAAPNHPESTLPMTAIPAGAKVSLIGKDKNGAGLLVKYNDTIGWMSTIFAHPSSGVGNIKPAIVIQPLQKKCAKYLGVIFKPQEAWTNDTNRSVIVQGSILRPAVGEQFKEAMLALTIEGNGKVMAADYIHTQLTPSSAVVLFSFLVADLQTGSKLKFLLTNPSNETRPFEVAFFSDECPQITNNLPGGGFVASLPVGKTKNTITKSVSSAKSTPPPTKQAPSVTPTLTPTPASQPQETPTRTEDGCYSHDKNRTFWHIGDITPQGYKCLAGNLWGKNGKIRRGASVESSTSSANISIINPTQFILDYYTEVNRGHYAITWSRLSSRFQYEKNQNDFAGYANFWATSVERVDVVAVRVQNPDPQNPVVYAALQVYQTDQCVRSEAHTFGLISDGSGADWLIDTQEILSSVRHCPTAIQPAPTWTPISVSQPADGCTYPTRLQKGGRAYVLENSSLPNRVRVSPSRQADVINGIPPGDSMTLLEGPHCAEGWIWWYVQADNGAIGWTSEGDIGDYWLGPGDATPTTPNNTCAFPTRLHSGGRAYVLNNPLGPNLILDSPSRGSQRIGAIQIGEGMTILDGPQCNDNMVWWYVQADNGAVGWTSEGESDEYWLSPGG